MNRQIPKKALALLFCFLFLALCLPLPAAKAADTAVFPYRVGDTLFYGSYPQSQVEEETLAKALDAISAEWTAYPYFAGSGKAGAMKKAAYAYYKDVTYKGVRYRGVMLKQYRPRYTFEAFPAKENAQQYNSGFELKKTYWFRFEPVEWIVLDPASGLLLSKNVLDAQPFSDTVYELQRETEEDGWSWTDTVACSDQAGLFPANRYESSTLRAWLNGPFYSTAFSKQQQARVAKRTLSTPDGDGETKTEDRVFLLSAADTENKAFLKENDWGEQENLLARASGTAYAAAQGLPWYWYGSSDWYLRTPTDDSGWVQTFGWGLSSAYAADTGCGVRPAVCVDFNELVSGDVDGDGAVTAADARGVLRAAISLAVLTPSAARYADVNGDGEVTTADARLVLRCAVQLEPQSGFSRFLRETAAPAAAEIPWGRKHEMGELSLSAGAAASLADRVISHAGSGAWTSSNPTAVTVAKDGTITAKKKGFSCVYLTDGGNRYYFFISVRSPLQDKIYALQEKYPSGYFWNAHTKSKRYPAVSEIPCDDHESGKYAYCIGQCAGFAYLLSDEVFGANAPAYYGLKKEDIKIGDYVRCKPNHSVFVIDRFYKGDVVYYDIYADENIVTDAGAITVAECNWDCRCGISWGRTIYLDDFSIDSGYSFTRYK